MNIAELVAVSVIVLVLVLVLVYIIHVVKPVDVTIKAVFLKLITLSFEVHGRDPKDTGAKAHEARATESASKSSDDTKAS